MGHAISLEEVRCFLHITTMTLRSGDSFWSDDAWLVVLFSWMFVLEMLTLGHSPLVLMMIMWDASLCQTHTSQSLSCTEGLSISRWRIHTGAYPPCWFWHRDSTFCLWLLLSMEHRVIDTLGSVFSAYLVWFGYSPIFVTHPSILHWTLLYLHPSYQSLTSFEPTYFIVLHDLIHFFCDQRRMQTSLELSGWVFTCLGHQVQHLPWW